jgi:hypothetical protein
MLQRTTAGGRTAAEILTLFEVILSMVVLSAAQVLHKSSARDGLQICTKGVSSELGGFIIRLYGRDARLLSLLGMRS